MMIDFPHARPTIHTAKSQVSERQINQSLSGYSFVAVVRLIDED
jgi:hypothetical protein